MSMDELRALFATTIGRETASTDRRYLEWKIREAGKGRVKVGTLDRRVALPEAEMMTLPWRLPRATVAHIDAARARMHVTTRSALLARALADLLESQGEVDAAAAVRATAPMMAQDPNRHRSSTD